MAVSASGLDLQGGDKLPRRKIESALMLQDNPGGMSREDWEDWADEAAAVITDLYADMGYLDAAVKIDRTGKEDGGKESEPRIRIREGEQYRFGRVDVSVPEGSPSVITSGRLRSRTGWPFEKETVIRDRGRILNAFGEAGFLHSRSAETLSPDTVSKTVDVRFRVDPGPAVVFDTLLIRNHREGDTTGRPGITRGHLLRSLL